MNTLNTWALTLTSLWRSGRHTAWAGAALAASLLAVPAGAQTPEPVAPSAPLRVRVVGGLASVNQYTRHEAPFWTRELARLTGGRASADIVPFDQAGLRGQEVLRLIQQRDRCLLSGVESVLRGVGVRLAGETPVHGIDRLVLVLLGF